MSENDSHTSRDEASEAARIMQDPNVSPTERSVAASDLSQASGAHRETSPDAASEASDVMRDPNATAAERSVAASDLSQADRERDQRS